MEFVLKNSNKTEQFSFLWSPRNRQLHYFLEQYGVMYVVLKYYTYIDSSIMYLKNFTGYISDLKV